jgi:hypothetical protein
MTLADRFNLDPTKALQAMQVAGDKPKHAEAWFAVLNWKVLPGDYMELCREVFTWIAERSISPRHDNLVLQEYVTGGFKDEQYGFTDRYKECFPGCAWDFEDSPILIMPAQFGKGRAGQSHRRADALCRTTASEYPLSVLEVACMIALHPYRLAADKSAFSPSVLQVVAPGTMALPPEHLEHFGWEGSPHQYESFLFAGEAMETVGVYGRRCLYVGNHKGLHSEHSGPVTAWKWHKHKD